LDWQNAKPLPYIIVNHEVYERAATRRNRLIVTIAPAADQSKATQAKLVATVVGAVLYLEKESNCPVISVTMICQQAANAFGELRLAQALYIPDEKGVGGTKNSQQYGQVWSVSAAKRGFTDNELKFLRLWAEMRDQYQKNGMTDEDALRSAIGKRMGIAPDSINPHENITDNVKIE
jgi:hypothetical protein